MNRRLNLRFLFVSLAGLAVVGLAVFFLHTYQMQRNAEVLLRQALEEKDPKKAITFFRHYLIYQPDDLEARVQYALTLEKAGTSAGQLRNVLEQLLRRVPQQHQLRYRLIHTLIRLRRFSEAIAEIDQLLPNWPQPAELEHIRGWCQEANGDFAAAAASFAMAIKQDPHRLESYVLLTEVLDDRLGQDEAAASAMNRLVQANPDSFRAHLLRGRFRQKHQDLPGAEQDLQQALQLAPKDAEVLLAATELAEARGQLQLARTYVERGLQLYPQSVALYKAMANLEFRAGQRQQALACLRQGLQQIPDSPDLLVFLADLLIDENNTQAAEETIDRLKMTERAPALVAFLQARLLLLKGNWLEANALLEKARADLAPASDWSGRVNFLLGLCYQHLGDTEQQLAAFQRAVQQEPSWTLARFGLAMALLANGRTLDALTELEHLQKAPDVPPALWTALARVRLRRNLGQPEKNRKWFDVEQALDRAAQGKPEPVEVPILRAEVLSAQKRLADAIVLLEQAWEKSPQEVRLPCALADLYLRHGQFDEALQVLEQAEKKLTDRLEIRLAHCRLWGARGGPQAGQALQALSKNLKTLPPGDQLRLLRELADTWFRLGEFQRAGRLWRQLADGQQNDLRSRLLLFDLAIQNRQLEEAKDLLAQIRTLEGPAGFHWRCGEVALMLLEAPGDKQGLQQASQKLHRLSRRQRHHPWVALLEARIAELEGHLDQAIVGYQRALEQGEVRPRTVYRLVQLLNDQGRFLETEQTLHRIEELRPLEAELAKLGATAALDTLNLPRALELARRAVAANSRDYRDLLWLARILHLARQDDQAEAALRRAWQLAGHTPDTWIALIAQLIWSGKRSQAEALVDQAPKKLPDDLAALVVGRGRELLGELEPAEAAYRQALKTRPHDFILLMSLADFFLRTDQPAQAVPMLRRLLEPATDAPAAMVVRARRQLALALGRDGNLRNYQEALALLDSNARGGVSTPADVRARALVLGSQPGQQEQALALFEKSLRRHPPTPEDKFGLALLCEAVGDHLRAWEIFQELLVTYPENPQFVARLGQVLVHLGELREAQKYLQLLQKLEPTSPRYLALQKALSQAGMVK